MEDGRGQQSTNLNPSSSSWSAAAAAAPQGMRSGCDWEGGLLNLHDPVLMNMNSSLYNMGGGGAPEMCRSSHSNLEIQHVKEQMQVGGRSRRKKTVVRDMDGCKKNNNGQVIHVRAKRGQATDSHSLAERVRREKINDKLKALQHLVPGCYKTMGMAVMLDVIITYVQSLQNQIEFLSMKLSAASMFYDFNSPEAEAMEAFQRTNGGNPCEEEEARDMERMMMMRDDDNQGFDPLHLPSSSVSASAADHHAHHLHSTWPF